MRMRHPTFRPKGSRMTYSLHRSRFCIGEPRYNCYIVAGARCYTGSTIEGDRKEKARELELALWAFKLHNPPAAV